MKPGWKTTEFWLTLAVGIPSFLVAAGIIQSEHRETLTDAITKVVSGIFGAWTIIAYIKSRAEVKMFSGGPSKLVLFFALFLCVGSVQAQPLVKHACLFGCCRNNEPDKQVVALLTQISSQQQQIMQLLVSQQQQMQRAPQATPTPQIIVMGSPYQHIPLGGMPYQQIPLGEAPRQQIPLGEAPRQQIPIGEAPKQQIPIGQQPRQEIPLSPNPQSQPPLIPIGPSPKANPSYQRYTLAQPVEWRPANASN